jgi:hypothetical protein
MAKSIITYLLLVGVPFAGLMWILERGEGHVAPPAIKGGWSVEGPLASCLGEQPIEVVFEQSGRFVHVTLGAARGDARLDDTHLRATIVDHEGGCGTIEIEGDFDEATEQFRGRASSTGCEACSDVPVVARRAAR